MALEGAPEWSIAAAGHQTAGKGRLGRVWRDEPGRSLMCSLLLRPTTIDPDDAGWIPLMAGAAWAEACRATAGAQVGCKWPNDLMIGRSKLGGILVETTVVDGRIEAAVVGAGLNLEAPADVEDATGLGSTADPEALLVAYLRAMSELYRPMEEGFADRVGERWTAVSATLGRDVRAVTSDRGEIDGVATGLDRGGALVIETVTGPVVVRSGEVQRLG
jgi:BirA family transcriptional regulator, biotin operon repressor / biotin---[acetyl-CoA-carboxylase] ligase